MRTMSPCIHPDKQLKIDKESVIMLDFFSLIVLLVVVGTLLLWFGRKNRRKIPQFIGAVLTVSALLLIAATLLLVTAVRNH